MTRKIRAWCDGAGRVVREAELRGKHARCGVCDQRFLPKESRDLESGELVRKIPPHKAY
jgi:hypothetical protein